MERDVEARLGARKREFPADPTRGASDEGDASSAQSKRPNSILLSTPRATTNARKTKMAPGVMARVLRPARLNDKRVGGGCSPAFPFPD